jgi:hypothetical protein
MKLLVLSLSAVLACVAGSALAQPLVRSPYGPYYDYPYAPPPPPGYGRGPATLCQRWCPADLSPCDPPNFKIADGRCSNRSRD